MFLKPSKKKNLNWQSPFAGVASRCKTLVLRIYLKNLLLSLERRPQGEMMLPELAVMSREPAETAQPAPGQEGEESAEGDCSGHIFHGNMTATNQHHSLIFTILIHNHTCTLSWVSDCHSVHYSSCFTQSFIRSVASEWMGILQYWLFVFFASLKYFTYIICFIVLKQMSCCMTSW